MSVERVFLIVLDGVGIGELPDAGQYGDQGSDTLRNTARRTGGLSLPLLEKLGLGCLGGIDGVPGVSRPMASYGRMAERSPGKDTTTGHWELAGLQLQKPFPVYPGGFPTEVISAFEEAAGLEILGNEVASGTEILTRLGDQHVRTGKPIVYTSADSVFQIAAHEGIIPVEELYRLCKIARSILQGPHAVGRVIARPFAGASGHYIRTPRRRDFSLPPEGETILSRLAGRGLEVRGVGKIEDIFAHQGLTWSDHTTDNEATMAAVERLAAERFAGLVFANCVDFDMVYGHRNDAQGFADALSRVDGQLARIVPLLADTDILIVTADHGCDPTTPSTDHSREYVPLLVYRAGCPGIDLGTRSSFSDVAATLAEAFDVGPWPTGASLFGSIRGRE